MNELEFESFQPFIAGYVARPADHLALIMNMCACQRARPMFYTDKKGTLLYTLNRVVQA